MKRKTASYLNELRLEAHATSLDLHGAAEYLESDAFAIVGLSAEDLRTDPDGDHAAMIKSVAEGINLIVSKFKAHKDAILKYRAFL